MEFAVDGPGRIALPGLPGDGGFDRGCKLVGFIKQVSAHYIGNLLLGNDAICCTINLNEAVKVSVLLNILMYQI